MHKVLVLNHNRWSHNESYKNSLNMVCLFLPQENPYLNYLHLYDLLVSSKFGGPNSPFLKFSVSTQRIDFFALSDSILITIMA